MPHQICSKTFGWEDQRQFAFQSGDFNPMHMDELAARRTPAGKPALHGMNAALWALDQLAEAGLMEGPIVECKMRFREMLNVGGTVSLWLVRDEGARLSAEVRVGETVATTVSVVRGEMGSQVFTEAIGTTPEDHTSFGEMTPLELSMESMAGRSGTVGVTHSSWEMYPSLSERLGKKRVAAMVALSRLVGMECPGLHSIFYSCHVKFVEGGEEQAHLSYRVEEVDDRFRLVTQAVQGRGIYATVVAVARMPPVSQAGMGEIATLVGRNEFAGTTALVIGGSRGLGELTAKVIAAGGGKAVITYFVGGKDAQAVCEEIRAWGGDCEAIPYDVRKPAKEQLQALGAAPSHLYYFATNPILKGVAGEFSEAAFAEFSRFYVTGFQDICAALEEKSAGSLRVFYPSSIFVEERPAGMEEYAMAKAAGEALCEEMNRNSSHISIVVKRLPKVLTDQTAAAVLTDTADAFGVMLPLIRECQSA